LSVHGARVCHYVRVPLHYPLALVLAGTSLSPCEEEAGDIPDQVEGEEKEEAVEECATLVPEEETDAGPVGQVVEVGPELQVLDEELEGATLSLQKGKGGSVHSG
jgi:hypothetical protein